MDDDAALWRRKYERERRACREAESLLESKALELWQSNEQLRKLTAVLEERVETRTQALRDARDMALAAEQRAEESSRAKSRFLASISHEIRTPLNAILNYARLIRGAAPDGSEHGEWIGHLLRNAERVSALLGNVLDLSRIEADRLEVEQHPVPLLALLEETVSLLEPHAAERQLALRLRLSPPLPGQVTSDSIRIQQILVNLISNALKFTHEGSVSLEAEATESALRLSVVDTGIGVSPAQLARIWEPFTQGHENQTRWYGGTGLGLDISRRLAVQLGGEMGVESAPGEGSRFWVSLPLAPADWAVPMEAPRPKGADERLPRLDGVTVLVVDDSADNRRLMELLLARAGARVELCNDGAQAVARLTRGPAGVDMVLMDVQMPVLDGLEATRQIRAAGLAVPIIAVTADATARTRQRAREVGCDNQLTKPISPAKLLSRVAATLPAPPPAPVVRRVPRSIGLPESLMVQYRADLRNRQEMLTAALAAGDPAEFAKINHQVAGSAGSYGYTELSERSREVMIALRAVDKQTFYGVPLQPLFDEIAAVLA